MRLWLLNSVVLPTVLQLLPIVNPASVYTFLAHWLHSRRCWARVALIRWGNLPPTPPVPFFSIDRFLDLHEIRCLHPGQMQEEDSCCRVCFRGVYSCHWKLASNSEGRVSVCRHAGVDSLSLFGCSQGLAEHRHDFRGLRRCQPAVLLSSLNIFYIMRNAGIIPCDFRQGNAC